VTCGARAVVAQQELSAPAVWRRLLEELPAMALSSALIIGREPVDAMDRLHSEVSDVWQHLDDSRVCWRTAFALAQVAPLPAELKDWTGIAGHLRGAVDWFAYGQDDVRKALGRLAGAWGQAYRPTRHLIAAEALRRGYSRVLPDPQGDAVDNLYEPALDLDVSGRKKFSGVGVECDELPLHVD
jgi:hypothetical protein